MQLSAQIDHLEVTAGGTQAIGVPFTITVTARDAANALVASTASVNLEGSPGGIVFDGDGNGIFDMADSAKALVGGSLTMNARIDASGDFMIVASGGGATGTSANIHVPVPVFDHFAIDPVGSQAAGAFFTMTVRAMDSANAPVGFTGTVDLSVDSGSITPNASPGFVAGVATFDVFLTASGSRTITVTRTGGTESGSTGPFTVTAGPLDHFSFAPITPQTAGVPFGITLTALDAFSNTVTAFTGTAAFSADAGSVTPAVSASFVAGIMSGNVSLSAAGSRTMTATRSGGTESGTSAAFALAVGTLDHFSIVPAAAPAAGSPFDLDVTARDAGENVVTSFTGSVDLAIDFGAITPAVSGAFAAGRLTIPISVTKADTRTITVQQTGGAASGSAQFVISSGPLDHFEIPVMFPSSAGSAFWMSVTARDANDNAVRSFTGTVDLSVDSGAINPALSDHFVGGGLNIAVMLYAAGTRTITVTRSGGTEKGSSPELGIWALALEHYSIAPIGPQVAGVPFSIVITPRDLYENVVPYFYGTVALSTDAGTISPATSGPLYAGNQAQSVTLTVAGSRTIRVRSSAGSETGTSNAFTVAAGTVDHFDVQANGPQTAGVAFPITVIARDQLGNQATAFTGTVAIASGGAAVTPATSAAFVAGSLVQDVTLTLAGSRTLTVSSGSASGSSGAILVEPAAADHLLFDPIPAQTAGVAFDVVAGAYDAFANLVGSFSGTATLTVDAGSIAAPPASFTAGRLAQKISVTLAGARTITATTGGLPAASSNAFTLLAAQASAAQSTLAASATSAVANGKDAVAIVATIRDSFGNAVGGASVTLSQSGGTTAINPPAVLTSPAGVASFSVTSTSAATVVFTATAVPGLVVTQSATVTFTASPATALRLTGSNSGAAGIELPLQLSAVDGGNIVDVSFAGDRTIVVSGPHGAATVRDKSGKAVPVGSPATIAFTRGVATVPLTATVAETVILNAATGGLTAATVTLTVSPGAVSGFRFESVPAAVVAGVPFGQGRLRAIDGFGNNVNSFDAATPVALKVSASLKGTLNRTTLGAADFSGGVASLAGLVYRGLKGSGTLAASSQVGSAVSPSISITTGSVASLAPSTACRDYGLNFRITLPGSDFIAGSSIYWGAVPLANSYADGATITAVVPVAQLAGSGGNVAVSVQDPFGNVLPGTQSFVVTAPLQIAEASVDGGPFCAASPAQFTGRATLAEAAYRWTDPKGVFFSSAASPRLAGVNVQTAGAYVLTVSAALCNPAGSPPVAVALAPAVPSLISTPDEVVAGSKGNSASVTNIDGARYSWSIDGGTIASGQGTSAIRWDATGTAITIKASVATGGTAGCSATPAKTVRAVTCNDPVAPVLASPANGVSLGSSKVHFTWNPVANASGYEIIVRSAAGALTINRKVTDTQADVDLPGGSFNWSVISYYGVCPRTAMSGERTVTVPSDPACASAPAPELRQPAYNASIVGDFVTFSWTAVPGALGYVVSLADSEAGAKSVLPPTGNTSMTVSVPTGRHFWWVQAVFSDCVGPYGKLPPNAGGGTYGTFRVYACGIAPKVVSGAWGSGFYGGSTQVDWTTVPGATSYIVEMFNIQHTVILRRTESYGPDFAGAVGRITVTPPEFPSSFRVTAVVPGCSSLSAEGPIDPGSSNCSLPLPESATLRLPADGATFAADAGAASVQLEWTHAPISDDRIPQIAYVLLSRDGGPWTTQAALDSRSVSTIQIALTPGSYRWKVKTHFSETYDLSYGRTTLVKCQIASEVRSFTVVGSSGIDCARQLPSLISPAPGRTVFGTPVTFSWTVADVFRYRLYITGIGQDLKRTIITTATSVSDVSLPPGDYLITLQADLPGGACDSAPGSIRMLHVRSASCVPTVLSAPAAVTAGSKFLLSWNAVGDGPRRYSVQASQGPSFNMFSGYQIFEITTDATSLELTEPAGHWYFRVRAMTGDCAGWLYSRPVAVTSVTPSAGWLDGFRFTFDWQFGQFFSQQFNASQSGTRGAIASLPNASAAYSFHSSEPWLAVTPAGESGAFSLTVDSRSLPPGENTAWLTATGSDGTSSTVPVVVNISSPLSAGDAEAPDIGSLILPVVAHVTGTQGAIHSDVTITNGGTVAAAYELRYTRAVAGEGAETGSSWLELQPGDSATYADVVAALFGDESSAGYVEVRQLSGDSGSALAGSRTYTAGAGGTTGQFVPALGSGELAGDGDVLTMTALEESDAFRTNIGFVETAGGAVSITLRVFDGMGGLKGEIPVALEGGRQRQLNGILAANGIRIAGGRVDAVVNGPGRVAAYASVVDNRSGDAIFVPAVGKGALPSTAYVLAGIGDTSGGGASWRSDVWLYNAGTDPVEATLTYRAQSATGAVPSVKISIAPGQVQELRDILRTRFGITSSIGALHVSTAAPASLIVTARTYSVTASGTYGQFIPARRAEEAYGIDDPALQINGVSETPSRRTNVGIAEAGGAPARVAITVHGQAGAEATTMVDLPAWGFVQLSRVLAPLSQNQRISIQVVGGDGRIVAYGSLVENGTNDPTYIPAR